MNLQDKIELLKKDEPENFILFLAYLDLHHPIGPFTAYKYCQIHVKKSGIIRMSPWDNSWASHDNLTAIRYFNKVYNLRIKIPLIQRLAKLWHPVNYISYLGLPNIPAIVSTFPGDKIRPNLFMRLLLVTFAKRNGDGVILVGAELVTTKVYFSLKSTNDYVIRWDKYCLDGVLLNFLRFKIQDMPYTEKTCAKELHLRFGEEWQKQVFTYYFPQFQTNSLFWS